MSDREAVVAYFRRSRDVMQSVLDDTPLIDVMGEIAHRLSRALLAGNKILLAGNGGSAADAQHIAGELLSRLNHDRAPLPAIALTTDSSVLTAIGNDYGYEQLFARQVLGLGRRGDVLIVLSTSGRSPNILSAIEAGRSQGLQVIGFTGRSGGAMADRCDLCLRAPSDSTPLIQQVHITAAHVICGMVEEAIFPANDGRRLGGAASAAAD